MKKIFILTFACLCVHLHSFSQGVIFDSLTLNEALRQAKATKKLVFVDCFTTWCAPCIYMTKEVFSQKEAGDFFNKHFINVMFDMEQEKGMEINRKYTVTNYPTYLILTPEGDEQYRLIGRDDLPRFIERISRGLDAKNALPVLEKEYAAGNMARTRMIDYFLALDDAYQHQTLQALFKEQAGKMSLEEKSALAFWPVFSNPRANPYTMESVQFVFDHLEAFLRQAGDKSVNDYLSNGYNALLTRCLTNKMPEEDVAGVVAAIREQLTARAIPGDMMHFKLNMAEALLHQRFEQAVVLFEKNLPLLSLIDIELIMGIFNKLDHRDKALVEKVAAISIEGITDPNFQTVMRECINYFKTKGA
jgi:thiol-disulfide isomerase/thioredoxin